MLALAITTNTFAWSSLNSCDHLKDAYTDNDCCETPTNELSVQYTYHPAYTVSKIDDPKGYLNRNYLKTVVKDNLIISSSFGVSVPGAASLTIVDKRKKQVKRLYIRDALNDDTRGLIIGSGLILDKESGKIIVGGASNVNGTYTTSGAFEMDDNCVQTNPVTRIQTLEGCPYNFAVYELPYNALLDAPDDHTLTLTPILRRNTKTDMVIYTAQKVGKKVIFSNGPFGPSVGISVDMDSGTWADITFDATPGFTGFFNMLSLNGGEDVALHKATGLSIDIFKTSSLTNDPTSKVRSRMPLLLTPSYVNPVKTDDAFNCDWGGYLGQSETTRLGNCTNAMAASGIYGSFFTDATERDIYSYSMWIQGNDEGARQAFYDLRTGKVSRRPHYLKAMSILNMVRESMVTLPTMPSKDAAYLFSAGLRPVMSSTAIYDDILDTVFVDGTHLQIDMSKFPRVPVASKGSVAFVSDRTGLRGFLEPRHGVVLKGKLFMNPAMEFKATQDSKSYIVSIDMDKEVETKHEVSTPGGDALETDGEFLYSLGPMGISKYAYNSFSNALSLVHTQPVFSQPPIAGENGLATGMTLLDGKHPVIAEWYPTEDATATTEAVTFKVWNATSNELVVGATWTFPKAINFMSSKGSYVIFFHGSTLYWSMGGTLLKIGDSFLQGGQLSPVNVMTMMGAPREAGVATYGTKKVVLMTTRTNFPYCNMQAEAYGGSCKETAYNGLKMIDLDMPTHSATVDVVGIAKAKLGMDVYDTLQTGLGLSHVQFGTNTPVVWATYDSATDVIVIHLTGGYFVKTTLQESTSYVSGFAPHSPFPLMSLPSGRLFQ